MLIGDICGIGPLYAEISAELRDLMKKNVNAIQQQRIVRDISKRLEKAARRGAYASLLISTYFAPNRSFRLCNTGHPPPFVYRRRTQEWSLLKPTDPPPLLPIDEALDDVVSLDEYQQLETRLEVGDMVLSMSNLLTECRNADGNILGLSGVLQEVAELDAEQPEELLPSLLDKLSTMNDENDRASEATLLLCRATGTRVGLKDNVLAPFRLLGKVSDNTKLD